jgi:spore coat-associated protein N
MDNRKRLAIGIAAVAVAVLAIGLGTYAAFTDTEDGPSGNAASGTLDLTVGSNASTTLFNQDNIAPGFTTTVDVTVRNVGTVPGTVTGNLTVTGADVTCTEPEAEAEGVAAGKCAAGGNLQDQMTVQVLSGPGVTTPAAAVPLKTFVNSPLPAGTLGGNSDGVYKLQFVLPAAADNKVQGDRISIGSTFTLNQNT